ncbi:hypothetical protein [Synechococcus sp. UW179A]|uniref:hypothetical protein n=1 Tax=Synechococcus sp. UW179A TaxID=2575510 RepID=UPI001FCB7F15|nr:hypothetical protein [Synechococcus sp. UW179A]
MAMPNETGSVMRWLLFFSGLMMSGMWVDLKAEQRLPDLQAGQSILDVDQTLTSTGWNPAPEGQVRNFEQQLAGNQLSSLASCSGTGVGYCRYDYQRSNKRLVVVTVPASQPDEAGRVARWWMESVTLNPTR